MKLLQRRRKTMRVLSMGRQGRTVHDELVDEIGSPPTVFEESFPFEWPETVAPQEDTPAERAAWTASLVKPRHSLPKGYAPHED